MSEFERPGYFYLGKKYDISTKEILNEPVLYDARDLTTHAVCVGMTGSGKTGLCTLILEEAALNGVPSILIDPKGDITNLCLTFPDLLPENFEPWVNLDDARRKGLSVSEYAAATARSWANGLAQWGQGPERIRRLKNAVDFVIYTPGSDAGLPVSILDTMRAPKLSWDEEEEALREKVQGTVSALLGLIGVSADPLQSREHILLSNIFEYAWRRSEDLDIARLIQYIQKPPLRKLGVFDIDTFFPEKDRFALAMTINNILAAPSFGNWIKGQPLDISSILYTPQGKPRAAIFYIAHLDDPQRMFFVTLLLEQIIGWVRAQSGTTSLRALVYFDELYGYLPPYPANPPSKSPLLTLLKQARAFGLGLVLTTQNPVDLDYKALTNTGTWFIGKLQTDRDKMRVLEGMEGIIPQSGSVMDRRHLDRLISSLDSRVFVMHNVHEDEPVVFMTRWAMSYLRGPLTRQQVRTLMADRREAEPVVTQGQRAAETRAEAIIPEGLSSSVPQIEPDIPQYFLLMNIPAERALKDEEKQRGLSLTPRQRQLIYEPKLLAWATVHYQDSKSGVRHSQEFRFLVEPSEETASIRWDEGEITFTTHDLDREMAPDALFADLPIGLGQSRQIKALEKTFTDYLYRSKALSLWYNPKLGLYSEVGESDQDFQRRCRQEASRLRDREAQKIKDSYEDKISRLKEKIRREERELAADELKHKARKREEVLSLGESVIGFLTSRRKPTTAVSKASRKRQMTAQAAAEVEESRQVIAELQEEIGKLEREMLDELSALDIRVAELLDQKEEYLVHPRRQDIKIDLFGIGWVPYWHITAVDSRGIERTLVLPAFRPQK